MEKKVGAGRLFQMPMFSYALCPWIDDLHGYGSSVDATS